MIFCCCWFAYIKPKQQYGKNKNTGLFINCTLNQDYSSRYIKKKKPKVIRTRIIVLTTMDAFFAIKTYVNKEETPSSNGVV
jgi:uncharacterized protein YueI